MEESDHEILDFRVTIDARSLNGGVIPTAPGQGHYASEEDYVQAVEDLLGVRPRAPGGCQWPPIFCEGRGIFMKARNSHSLFVSFVLAVAMLIAGCGSDGPPDQLVPSGENQDASVETEDPPGENYDPPEVEIVVAPSSLSNETDPRVEFECLDNRSCEFTCRLNDFDAEPCDSPVEYEDLDDGEQLFEVVAVDEYELESEPVQWSWTVDTVVPIVEDLSGPGDPTTQTSAVFDFDCSKEKCQFTCELTGLSEGIVEASTECEPGHIYTGLADDDYTFTVTASDQAGNTSVAESWSWTVDSTLLETNWAMMSAGVLHTCGVRVDGSLWCWGKGDYGQLGLGDTSNRTTPEQVGSDTDWKSVSVGSPHTCGVRVDNTLWCWGKGEYGQLGLGDELDRTTPERVGGDKDWESVSAGIMHTCGVRVDGSLWCWGKGEDGRLGLGDELHRSTPEQVGGDVDWESVSSVLRHTCGVRNDGSLWCWGKGASGRLGLGDDTSNRTTPEQVGSDFDWGIVSSGARHSCGVRNDGSLWCWGVGLNGRLGLGSGISHRTIPEQVGSDTDWESVSLGGGHSCGLRADSSLWCWGQGTHGQVGVGTLWNRTTPRQVGSGEASMSNSWRRLSAGGVHTCGLRDGGSLWCWGAGELGQLGLGDDTSNRTTPEQVGSDVE